MRCLQKLACYLRPSLLSFLTRQDIIDAESLLRKAYPGQRPYTRLQANTQANVSIINPIDSDDENNRFSFEHVIVALGELANPVVN